MCVFPVQETCLGRRCQSNSESSRRCAICPREIDDLLRKGAPLRQCGRASLFVNLRGDEMPLLIEMVVELGVNCSLPGLRHWLGADPAGFRGRNLAGLSRAISPVSGASRRRRSESLDSLRNKVRSIGSNEVALRGTFAGQERNALSAVVVRKNPDRSASASQRERSQLPPPSSGSGANGRIWPTMMSAELPEGWA
jgi:hypothetical protein